MRQMDRIGLNTGSPQLINGNLNICHLFDESSQSANSTSTALRSRDSRESVHYLIGGENASWRVLSSARHGRTTTPDNQASEDQQD